MTVLDAGPDLYRHRLRHMAAEPVLTALGAYGAEIRTVLRATDHCRSQIDQGVFDFFFHAYNNFQRSVFDDLPVICRQPVSEDEYVLALYTLRADTANLVTALDRMEGYKAVFTELSCLRGRVDRAGIAALFDKTAYSALLPKTMPPVRSLHSHTQAVWDGPIPANT